MYSTVQNLNYKLNEGVEPPSISLTMGDFPFSAIYFKNYEILRGKIYPLSKFYQFLVSLLAIADRI